MQRFDGCTHLLRVDTPGQGNLNDGYSYELLESCKKGDRKAQKRLYDLLAPKMMALCMRYAGSRELAEDLLQDGFVTLFSKMGNFKNEGSFEGWARRVFVTTCLMYLRKNAGRKGEVSFDEPLNVDWEGNVLLLSDVLGTDSDVIYKDVESGAEREILAESFARLGEREKKILKMRFGLFGEEEKTQKEIAAEMGISQSYISRLEKKIVGKLKKEIGKLV